MKRHIFGLLAALVLLSVPAAAQSSAGSMEHFVRQQTYSGQFSDLPAEHTFYDNISALYEYGLTNGKADGTFGLQDNVTVGQSLIFAARLRSLYFFGDPEAGPRQFASAAEGLAAPYNTYAPYLQYLKSGGAVGAELDDVLTSAADRAQVAHVLANALPAEALPAINDSLVTQCYASRKFITDVTEYTPYQQDILTLYRCGILVGSDDTGSYLPGRPITRGALAAMLTRIADPALRITPGWSLQDAYSAAGTTLADLVVPGDYLAAPETEKEIDQAIRYLLSGGSDTLELQYPSLNADQARALMSRMLDSVKRYCEQSYNSLRCSYTTSGSISLKFYALDEAMTPLYRQEALEAAIAVHDALWDSGVLTADMNETAVAQVYYDWICANCSYDYEADGTSVSHLPYSLFENGKAVCDGYTGAYNLLLKLEGIDCYALANEDHIWTVAVLDGEEVHIDTTWGDAGLYPNPRYFAMSPSESYTIHPW